MTIVVGFFLSFGMILTLTKQNKTKQTKQNKNHLQSHSTKLWLKLNALYLSSLMYKETLTGLSLQIFLKDMN